MPADSLRCTSALTGILAFVFLIITVYIDVFKLVKGSIGMPRLLPDITDINSAWKLFTIVRVLWLHMSSILMPDSPAELGNKIYEMMAMALGGRWGRLEDNEAESTENATESDASSSDGSESQVVEASEVRTENDPWSA
ncbi:unnamed protein product [Fraxinus pennsylvanica]|uniref:Uncharacterized protein n=1 Tax=Fraxinus pennsylvanica TaxID=56036 RepID=A0AAD2EEY4_9LAMI|nr:unnamed protein product [Fraxinus pennsylvanica]